MGYAKFLTYGLVLLSLLSVLTFSAGEEKRIGIALGSLCGTLKGVLAVGMLLLVVLAAIVYAVGQVLGAETRARASVWATAMFTGAIIGALLYILLPYIVGLVMTGSVDQGKTWMDACCKEGAAADCAGKF